MSAEAIENSSGFSTLATHRGAVHFQGNPALQTFVGQFLENPTYAHRLVNDGNRLGRGQYSDVVLVGGSAIKLTAPQTGNWGKGWGYESDIDARFRLQVAMYEHLQSGQSGVVVPEPLFAVQAGHADLFAMQNMTGFQKIEDWRRAQDYVGYGAEVADNVLTRRVMEAFAGSVLVGGLTDLSAPVKLLHPGELHPKNVLIEEGNGNPFEAVVCIIDQDMPELPIELAEQALLYDQLAAAA